MNDLTRNTTTLDELERAKAKLTFELEEAITTATSAFMNKTGVNIKTIEILKDGYGFSTFKVNVKLDLDL